MLALLLAFSLQAQASAPHVCHSANGVDVVVRQLGGNVLVVNPETLETRVKSDIGCGPASAKDTADIERTPYGRALRDSTSGTRPVNANEGLKKFDATCADNAMVLTMDLCPAGEPNAQHPHRPLDEKYFDGIEQWAQANNKQAHVTLFLSGMWITRHSQQVARLKKGWPHIKFTFANHSDTHPYTKGVTYAQNFMTQMSAMQFREEVLSTEKKMLAAGLTPSVYFRFPGLMSNKTELEVLRELGLIPVGTSAWTAVNGSPDRDYAGFDFPADEAPKAGRIVLTHANGNEELGVRGKNGFLTYLAQHSEAKLADIATAVRCQK